MTNAFWKWLTGLNARGLCLGVLVLFAAQVFWLLRQEMGSPDLSVLAGTVPGATAGPQPRLPDFRMLRNLPVREEPIGNPFSSPFLENALAVRRELGDLLERGPEKLPAFPSMETSQTVRNESRFLPLPAVELLYRGMMRRTDGVDVAFIDNQTTGTRSHYKKDDNLLGYRILEIRRAHVVLDDGRQTRHILKVNEAQTLREAAP